MNNYRYTLTILLIFFLFFFPLVGCSSGQNEAAKAIEAYITALSEQDANQISILSCSDWEQDARTELDSFTAVSSKIEDLVCESSGQDGDDLLISCSGKIALDYNGEAQEIDLSARTYIARQEGGEWRMCGYSK